MNNANCLAFMTNNVKGIQNKSKRLSVVEYFKNKLGNYRILFLKKHIPHLIMKIFGRMNSMYLSFTNMISFNPVVSLLLILEISTFRLFSWLGDKNGRILIFDVKIDEIRYVLVNIYVANTKVEQVQVLCELSELIENINFLKENCIGLAGDIQYIFR